MKRRKFRDLLRTEPGITWLVAAMFFGPWISLAAGLFVGSREAIIAGALGAGAILVGGFTLSLYSEWDEPAPRERRTTELNPITASVMLAWALALIVADRFSQASDTSFYFWTGVVVVAWIAAALTPWGARLR